MDIYKVITKFKFKVCYLNVKRALLIKKINVKYNDHNVFFCLHYWVILELKIIIKD